MPTLVQQYLDDVRDNLRLDGAAEADIISELQNHIEEELEEMRADGLSAEEAAGKCLSLLGSARLLARQLYEAHSQGTWWQAALAAAPHALFALLFMLNWWQASGPVIIILGFILITAIIGWRRGKPVWFFPWLGYSLVPAAVAGLALLYLPRGWSWLAIIIYLPLALWFLIVITVQTIRRDWLFTSLMFLPAPAILGWFLTISTDGAFPEPSLDSVQYFAGLIGLSFLALAATAAVFIRLRQRWLRFLLLTLSGIFALALVAIYAEGGLGMLSFLMLGLMTLAVLLGPAIVERGIKHRQPH